jgi:hypothetical protein
MKKLLTIIVIIFASTLVMAKGKLGWDKLPSEHEINPCNGLYYIGKQMTNRTRTGYGDIKMQGYIDDRRTYQCITLTYPFELRPFCYWYVSIKNDETRNYSEGRCDLDNDEVYEFYFNSEGKKSLTQDIETILRKSWKNYR